MKQQRQIRWGEREAEERGEISEGEEQGGAREEVGDERDETEEGKDGGESRGGAGQEGGGG